MPERRAMAAFSWANSPKTSDGRVGNRRFVQKNGDLSQVRRPRFGTKADSTREIGPRSGSKPLNGAEIGLRVEIESISTSQIAYSSEPKTPADARNGQMVANEADFTREIRVFSEPAPAIRRAIRLVSAPPEAGAGAKKRVSTFRAISRLPFSEGPNRRRFPAGNFF